MAALVFILCAFALILVLVRIKVPLAATILAGSVLVGVLFGLGPVDIGMTLLSGAVQFRTIGLAVVTVLLLLLSATMQAGGQMERIVDLAKAMFRRPAVTMAALPAMIGLLPMPGGALFSAPMVASAAGQRGVPGEKLSAINYWFRHVWEHWWPLYPGVITAMGLTQLGVTAFVSTQLPLGLLMIGAGLLLFRKTHPDLHASAGGGTGRWLELLLSASSIWMILLIWGVGKYLLGFAPLHRVGADLAEEIRKYLPLVVALAISWVWTIFFNHLSTGQVGKVLRSGRVYSMAGLVVTVMIFQHTLESVQAAGAVGDGLTAIRIPAVLVMAALPFIAGLVTGLAVGFVGISFPIVLALIPGGEPIRPYVALAYAFGHMGQMCSPLHLCQVVSNRYFETSYGPVYRQILPSVALLAVLSVAYFVGLHMLFTARDGSSASRPVSSRNEKGVLMSRQTDSPRSDANFIQTFLIYQAKGPTLVSGDEKVLSKYDILYFGRFRYDQIDGDTWGKVRALNPDIKIYLYQQGPDVWAATGRDGRNSTDEMDVRFLNNIARFKNARGHSMGNLDDDNPDLFLLKDDGERAHTYRHPYRYLMDFGAPKFHKYWLEATEADIVDQPWAADGIFIDNTAPQQWGYPSETPAKYDTDAKWRAGMHKFQTALSKRLHERGQKVWTNTCCSLDPFGFEAWVDLDNEPDGPDLLAEEGAFCHGWGDGGFYSEAEWKRQVDIMTRLRRCGITIFSHLPLREGESGTDGQGRPMTYWQGLWYSLCSYLLGKNDELNNAYFFYFSHVDGYRHIYWYDEYERIDLGRARGAYERLDVDGGHAYWRAFADGYVYVNPTEEDVTGIELPAPCKQLSHEKINDDPASLEDVRTIDLKSHHGTALVKTASLG